MPSSRKSTPRRGRSSSVASNVSTTSAKQEGSVTSSPRRTKASAAAAAAKEEAAVVTSSASKAEYVRPPLPKIVNPALPQRDVPVKLQVIRRDGKHILIGRVKLPTVGEIDHAFLLKRFDTDAIAALAMFRLAFPYADDEAERGEMAYLERRFEADLANGGRLKAPKKERQSTQKVHESEVYIGELPEGSTGVKLTGTWIPCSDALEIAKDYGLLRYAQPLIEAKATRADNGRLILTPSKNDKISTPTSTKIKRSRVKEADADETNESPTITRTRTTKRVKEDGSEEIVVEKTETILEPVGTLSPAQIQVQIKEAQSLAKGIQASGETSSFSRKRRAMNQTPTAYVDQLADEEYEGSNSVVRSLRRGGRAVRRRPIVTTAGALSAVGAGTLAWISGGNLDAATQILQQGVANLQSWFFY